MAHVTAPGIPLDHPLILDHFDSIDFVDDLLKKYGSATGVTYIVSGSRKTVDGQYRVGYSCSRSGHYEPSGAGIRKRRSVKTNCKWAGDACKPSAPDAVNPMWVFCLENNTHNHPPLEAEYRTTRRLTSEMKRMVEQMPGDTRPRCIIAAIKERYPDALVLPKDICNYRAKLRALCRRSNMSSAVFQVGDETKSAHSH